MLVMRWHVRDCCLLSKILNCGKSELKRIMKEWQSWLF
jgi:hypothetical protein